MTTPQPQPPHVDERRDVRPIVGRDETKASIVVFAAVAVVLAISLFWILETRRERLAAPAVSARSRDRSMAALPPPALLIPAEQETPPPPPTSEPEPTVDFDPAIPQQIPPAIESFPVFEPQLPAPPPTLFDPPAAPPPTSFDRSPVLVIDQGGPVPASINPQEGLGAPAEGEPDTPAGSVEARNPAQAERLRQRETTIVRGSLIPAVLETALDSTRPGQARALVSQDVYGYGRRHVLIPRGSRLIGEYRSDMSPGQNRAVVQWTRLDRPDGVTIAIDSPAADTLGRAGIRGRVNSHFLQRFGAAILQSSLDLGVSLAASSVGNAPVIIALPRGGGATQAIAQPQRVQPTLTVEPGARISVFVARDLDFTAVERQR